MRQKVVRMESDSTPSRGRIEGKLGKLFAKDVYREGDISEWEGRKGGREREGENR